MKKFAFLLTLFLLLSPSLLHAEARIVRSNQLQLNGYIVSVEETDVSITVQVRSTSPYGVFLQSSKNQNRYENNQNNKYLTAVFDVAPTLQLQNGINASTGYSVKMSKDYLNKIFLTVKTGDFKNAIEELVWERTPVKVKVSPTAPPAASPPSTE